MYLSANGASSQGQFILRSGNAGTFTERMRIDSSGNVGIGTASPATKLVINEPANGTSDILTLHADSDGGGSNNGIASIKLMGNSNHAAYIKGGHLTSGKTILTFHTDDYPSSYSPQERLRIDSSGNVGIGTTSPGRQLEVNSNTANTFIRILSSDSGNAGIEFGDQSDTVQGAIYQDSSDNSLKINGYNNATRMLIDSSGNVGIGTTSPANDAQLTLSGTDEAALMLRRSGSGKYDAAIHNYSGNLFFKGGADSAHVSGLNTYMQITSNTGNVEITDGDLKVASGHGIDFSATSDASGKTSELLDDYEEGSWSATSLNYDYDSNVAQRGHYIKVGRLVHAFFRVKFHNQSTHVGNQLVFSGLPFTAASGNPYDVNVGGYAQGYASIDFHRIFVSPGTSAAYWYISTGSSFNNSTSLNGADVRGCITYTAAT